jgi:cytochrome c oxidase subunit 2
MTFQRLLLSALATCCIGGCTGVQSALDPHGPHAAEITSLFWLLFAVGGLVIMVVVAAVFLAIRGGPALRARLKSKAAVYTGGIVFPTLVLTILLAASLALMRTHLSPGEETRLSIEVTGEQWWWRVAYRLESGEPVASANEINIPAGESVSITLRSADVIHSFWVPALGGKVDMIPGRTTQLRLRADRVGIYRGQCAEYCGGPHALMALPVRAMPIAEFDEWLANEGSPAVPSGQETRGEELFRGAGCGGCHSVRGTQARGAIGPDLTHIGSRLSVGVDTEPVSVATIARFITDGQHIKPGNRMPPFRIFSDDELAMLAAYLAGLK